MAVSYGSYNFPTPLPIVSISDEPIYVAGELDSSLTKISLVGSITGANLSGLHVQKKQLISGLLPQFQTLTVEGETFAYSKPSSLSFLESDLTTFLPYSVQFESHDEKSFSQYFGVSNPTDIWTYKEQDGRIVSATHNASARGLKTSATDPLDAARTFVNSRLGGFENLSVFNPKDSAFLQSKTEEVDRFLNTYSVTEDYIFSTSQNPISDNAVISATTQVNYVKNGSSSVSVNGSIVGDITGAAVTTGLFSPNDATTLAKAAIQKSKSTYEDSIYDVLAHGPNSYNYDVKEDANKIDFSFRFDSPFNGQTSDVKHEYTVSISATKDQNTLTATIDGEFTYQSPFDVFTSGNIESAPRFLAITEAFEATNFFNLASTKYAEFISRVGQYETSSYLNPIPAAESTTKNPFTPSISYSISYDNRTDLSNGTLQNLTWSVTEDESISRTEIKESNGGFSTNSVISRTIGKIQASANSDDDESKIGILEGIVSRLLEGQGCDLFEEKSDVGTKSISHSKGYYF